GCCPPTTAVIISTRTMPGTGPWPTPSIWDFSGRDPAAGRLERVPGYPEPQELPDAKQAEACSLNRAERGPRQRPGRMPADELRLGGLVAAAVQDDPAATGRSHV